MVRVGIGTGDRREGPAPHRLRPLLEPLDHRLGIELVSHEIKG